MEENRLLRDDAPDPPSAPETGRSLRYHPAQVVALAVLLLITGGALAGVFNEHERMQRVAVGGLEVQVSNTTRSRLQQTEIVSVMVINSSGRMADSVYVAVDTSYMSSFSEVEMLPEPEFPYATYLLDMPQGSQREVRVSARGGRAGTHRGYVVIGWGRDSARVPLSTFILP
jgi:hypothetical protein